ncbi:hypothetical protein EVAR_46169_1 [Eumeta japonica]|uniref:Uncharacterized protein n=1 Tax=Eumeta variegata TaxID=151549 RepID=A0A4C1Y225_EUMVA|nr:hypothetical protein EVAR_46169_1 [Eumeta japonica]
MSHSIKRCNTSYSYSACGGRRVLQPSEGTVRPRYIPRGFVSDKSSEARSKIPEKTKRFFRSGKEALGDFTCTSFGIPLLPRSQTRFLKDRVHEHQRIPIAVRCRLLRQTDCPPELICTLLAEVKRYGRATCGSPTYDRIQNRRNGNVQENIVVQI